MREPILPTFHLRSISTSRCESIPQIPHPLCRIYVIVKSVVFLPLSLLSQPTPPLPLLKSTVFLLYMWLLAPSPSSRTLLSAVLWIAYTLPLLPHIPFCPNKLQAPPTLLSALLGCQHSPPPPVPYFLLYCSGHQPSPPPPHRP